MRLRGLCLASRHSHSYGYRHVLRNQKFDYFPTSIETGQGVREIWQASAGSFLKEYWVIPASSQLSEIASYAKHYFHSSRVPPFP